VNHDIHVVPVDDLVAHNDAPSCWCMPTLEGGIYVHHSADQREFDERLAEQLTRDEALATKEQAITQEPMSEKAAKRARIANTALVPRPHPTDDTPYPDDWL
jgi:hypothetical protein